jgi:hypothetical protein
MAALCKHCRIWTQCVCVHARARVCVCECVCVCVWARRASLERILVDSQTLAEPYELFEGFGTLTSIPETLHALSCASPGIGRFWGYQPSVCCLVIISHVSEGRFVGLCGNLYAWRTPMSEFPIVRPSLHDLPRTNSDTIMIFNDSISNETFRGSVFLGNPSAVMAVF